MRIVKILSMLILFASVALIATEKNTKSHFDYAHMQLNIKNLEKTKDLYKIYLITAYEKMRQEYLEKLFARRAILNSDIERMLQEERINKEQYNKLIEMSFAALANVYVEFPPLQHLDIETSLEES